MFFFYIFSVCVQLTKKILDTELDVYTVAAAETKIVGAKAADDAKAISGAQELAQLQSKLAKLEAQARKLHSARGWGSMLCAPLVSPVQFIF